MCLYVQPHVLIRADRVLISAAHVKIVAWLAGWCWRFRCRRRHRRRRRRRRHQLPQAIDDVIAVVLAAAAAVAAAAAAAGLRPHWPHYKHHRYRGHCPSIIQITVAAVALAIFIVEVHMSIRCPNDRRVGSPVFISRGPR